MSATDERRGCRIVASMLHSNAWFSRTVFLPNSGRGIDVERRLEPGADGKPQSATVLIPEKLWMKRTTAEQFAVAFAVALELAAEAEALPMVLSTSRPRDEKA